MLYDFLLALAAVALLLSPLMIHAYPSRELRRRIRVRQHQQSSRQRDLQGEDLPPITESPVVPGARGTVRVTPRNALKWLFLQQETVHRRSSGKSA